MTMTPTEIKPELPFLPWRNKQLELVESGLAQALDTLGKNQPPEVLKLVQAMGYTLLGGGKRLRPLLCLAASLAVGCEGQMALPASLAVEMVHTYSLIHDDLPAMDNDDLRRGKPTCHKVYGEGVAILAGDALLTLAFEVLGAATLTSPELTGPAILVLSKAAGAVGMVGGQALDLSFEGQATDLSLERLKDMEARKTGELMSAALVLGGLFGGGKQDDQARLKTIGHDLGLAFQIQDDLLNLEGDPAQLGKAVGSDTQRGKASFPAVAGASCARAQGDQYLSQALDAATSFGVRGTYLKELIESLAQRKC